jgi:hypothetical protein
VFLRLPSTWTLVMEGIRKCWVGFFFKLIFILKYIKIIIFLFLKNLFLILTY